MLLEILKAILFGIVEGITEWAAYKKHRAYDSA